MKNRSGKVSEVKVPPPKHRPSIKGQGKFKGKDGRIINNKIQRYRQCILKGSNILLGKIKEDRLS
jgi:hypothetical protein